MENLKERVISALNIQNSLLSVAVIYTIVSPTWQAISLTLILSSYNAFRCYLVMRDTQGIGRMLGTQIGRAHV